MGIVGYNWIEGYMDSFILSGCSLLNRIFLGFVGYLLCLRLLDLWEGKRDGGRGGEREEREERRGKKKMWWN